MGPDSLMRLRRRSKMLSLDDLARELNINRGTLALIETGRLKPTAEQWEKIKAYFPNVIPPEKLLQPFDFGGPKEPLLLSSRVTPEQAAQIDQDVAKAAADLKEWQCEKTARLRAAGKAEAAKWNELRRTF